MRYIAIFVVALVLNACGNPYAEYYKPNTKIDEGAYFKSGEPKLIIGSNRNRDFHKMTEDGFRLIGWSTFNSKVVSNKSALAQAKRVGADRVVVYKKYTNSESGVTPLTLPDTQTTYHSGTVTGIGGMATYGGTSTTYGTRTTYIPYSIDRYDQTATYWRRLKPGGLGVGLMELSDEDRKKIGSNKGAVISIVRRDSAAYRADLIPGDILRAIGGDIVTSRRSAFQALAKNYGKTAEFIFWRSGKHYKQNIFIPDLP
jgi:hypothetical protein